MDTLVQTHLRYEENAKWVGTHYDELKEKYNNRWIAVLGEKVIAEDRSLDRLVRRARKRYPEHYGEIAFEYVTKKQIEMILEMVK